jgi:hypothetical protein
MRPGPVSKSTISEDARQTYRGYTWHHLMDMNPQLPNRLLNGSPPQIRSLLRGILLPHVMIRIRFQYLAAVKEVFHHCPI